MKFVDEHDDPAFAALDFVKHRLQPFFKFTAIFCARNKGPHVQCKKSAILQIVGDVAAYDTERKPLGNCGFADAGFTDKAGVVLRFS